MHASHIKNIASKEKKFRVLSTPVSDHCDLSLKELALQTVLFTHLENSEPSNIS